MIELQRILHVEDDASIRLLVKVALETVGKFSVVSCAGGPEAIDRAPKFEPQLVLLDVMMPGMDGPATFEGLKNVMELDGVPVIFMTAKVQPRELRHYHDLGGSEVITKPFDPMELPERLKSIWRRFHA